MTITEADRSVIEALPPQEQEIVWNKVRVIEAVEQRGPKVPMSRAVSEQVKKTRFSPPAINRWIAQAKKHGVTGLIQGRVHH